MKCPKDPDDVHIFIQQEHISITHAHKYACCKHAYIHASIHIFHAYIHRYILNTYTYVSCALISFSTFKVIYLIFKFLKIIIRLHFPSIFPNSSIYPSPILHTCSFFSDFFACLLLLIVIAYRKVYSYT